jgi:hypothetical protein
MIAASSDADAVQQCCFGVGQILPGVINVQRNPGLSRRAIQVRPQQGARRKPVTDHGNPDAERNGILNDTKRR